MLKIWIGKLCIPPQNLSDSSHVTDSPSWVESDVFEPAQ